MKPPRFDYVRAASVDEAVEVLAEHGDDARVLAGGQSLMAMLNMRLVAPEVLVDISRVPELATISHDGDAVEIGAAVTQAALQRVGALEAHLPLVARALPFVGHYQTRARGTVCGSIAHADPSSELPLCLAALDGEVVLRSARGTRTMVAADFQRDVLTTACEPNEMIVSVRFPLRVPGEGCAFAELGIRHGDFAIVAVAAVASATRVRIAVGGCADRPYVVESPPAGGPGPRGRAERPGLVPSVRRRSPRQRTLSPRPRTQPGTASGGGGNPMPRLSDRAPHVDARAPDGRNVHCNGVEPLAHRPAETHGRCRG